MHPFFLIYYSLLFYVKLDRFVYRIRNVFTVFLALLHAFGQQIFYLPVYGTEIILRPRGYCVIQLLRKPKRYLLFLCHSLIQAAGIDYRLSVSVAAEHNEEV